MVDQRELVTLDELSARLTSELQEIEDCEGSEITVKYRLRELDADGCNWSDVSIRVGPNATAKYLEPYVDSIVTRARAIFNVKD